MRAEVPAERSVLLFRQSYALTFYGKLVKTQSVALATVSAKLKVKCLESPHYA